MTYSCIGCRHYWGGTQECGISNRPAYHEKPACEYFAIEPSIEIEEQKEMLKRRGQA